MKKIDVNSDWREPGNNIYLREYVAYNVFRYIIVTQGYLLSYP